MDWTDKQKRAIGIRNSNILVSAAAGSGKTAVLVERIVELILNEKVDIDKFLVVTFTKAAASGMKRKIQSALVEASKDCQNTRHIRRQLGLLNKSHITTIHSFCMDIVKDNFHIVGLDPSFSVGASDELSLLLDESIEEVLEAAYGEGSEDFYLFTESFGDNRGDWGLFKIIERLYKFILSFPAPFEWLDASVEMIGMGEEEFKSSAWIKEIKNYINMQIDGVKSLHKLSLDICVNADGLGAYEISLEDDLEKIDKLSSVLDGEFELLLKELQAFSFSRLKSIPKEDKEFVDKYEQERVKEIRDEYKDIVKGLQVLLPYTSLGDYRDDINWMKDPMIAFKKLVMEVDRAYKEKKSLKSIVDFNDLEHFALQILRDREKSLGVAELYRDKFDYIFIDEYQDSNSLQETIIGEIKGRDNLFMVGDVKQSIYRFRLADPSIFNSKYENFARDREDLGEEVIDRLVELNKNFRSRKEVLDATNYVFERIMSKDLGEIDYDENVFLRCGNTDFKEETWVELDIISRDKHDDKDLNDELKAMDRAEVEALFIARRIKTLLKDKVFSRENEDKLKSTEYKDIVILSRAVTSISSIYEEVFRRESIPFYIEGGGGYYETIEVQVMMNLLKLIDNKRQDIPLLSIMRSFIGGFTTEELLEIRVKYPKFSYSGACKKYANGVEVENKGEFKDELVEKLQVFFEKIDQWTDRSRYTKLSQLIWEILLESGYYTFVGTLANGKIRQANLRLLTDRAHEFETTSMKGLFQFLRYVEKINSGNNDKISTAKTIGENDNVVRMMTIHGSKGLEFPVVILAGLDKGFNLQDTRDKILMHNEYGLAPKYINVEDRVEKNTIARLAISKKIVSESLSEEMRLLYVAMTRAVDKLIMVGETKDIEGKYKTWEKGCGRYFLYNANSYMDWICSSIFQDMERGEIEDIFKEGEYKSFILNKISSSDLIEVEERGSYSIEKLETFLGDVKDEDYTEVDRRLGYKYPHEDAPFIPSKLSVTAIKNLNKEKFDRLSYNIPELSSMLKFDKDKKRIRTEDLYKGSEIGTLIHLVMEKFDLGKAIDKEGLKRQLAEMKDKGQISDLQFEYIEKNYIGKIESFFSSHIGERMMKSNRIKRESPFVIKRQAEEVLEGLAKDDFILVQGIIDCYFEEDGEIVLIDYKTDRVKFDNTEKIKAEYKDQIASYKNAIEKTTGKRVKESYLYLFSSGELIEI